MTVFHIEVTQHGREFGATPESERAVLSTLLHNVGHMVASGREISHEQHAEPLMLNGLQVGKFWMGPDARSATPRR